MRTRPDPQNACKGATLGTHAAFSGSSNTVSGRTAATRVKASPPEEPSDMTEKKGHGSETAQKANAKAAKEGEKNPRKSSAAQAELGKKGAAAKKK